MCHLLSDLYRRIQLPKYLYRNPCVPVARPESTTNSRYLWHGDPTGGFRRHHHHPRLRTMPTDV